MGIFSKNGFLSKLSKNFGWVIGGENPYFENRVGEAFNNLTGASAAADASFQYNEQAQTNAMIRDIQLWNMQNQYNTPAAAIARMARAGININPMTYAVGHGNMSSVASSVSSGAGGANMSGSGVNPLSTIMGLMQGIGAIKVQNADVGVKNAQRLNIEAQTDHIREQTAMDKATREWFLSHGVLPASGGSIQSGFVGAFNNFLQSGIDDINFGSKKKNIFVDKDAEKLYKKFRKELKLDK